MNRPTNLDIFIYLRKSRSDIENEQLALKSNTYHDTLAKHRKDLLELAAKEGHNVVKIFEEVVTGENLEMRREIQKMLREIDNGAVEAVLVMDLDRLGRGDMMDAGILFNSFKYSETLIITPTEVINCNSEGAELLFGIKAIIAREELKQITKRMQRGRTRSASEGKSITRKPPYGYKRDENLKLYPDPVEAPIVQKIFQMTVDGYGRQAVVKKLDQMGIKPPQGDIWEQSTISYIVKNEVYLGRIIWGKQKNLKRNGKYITKTVLPENWTRKENAHEALVSEELWKEANLAIKRRYKAPVKEGSSLSNPLAGILKCGVCGRAMYYMPKPDRPNPQLRCINPGCQKVQKGVLLYLVEERILECLHEIVRSAQITESEVLSVMDNFGENIQDICVQLETVQEEKREIEQMRQTVFEMLEKKIYTEEMFLERQNKLSKQLKEKEELIKRLSNEYQIEKQKVERQRELIPKIKSVLQVYRETQSAEKKNMLLKSVILEVTLTRRIEWKEKDQFEINVIAFA